MNTLFVGLVAMLLLGCVLYFWYRATLLRVGLITIILGFIFFPVAFFVGLYWLIKDLWFWFAPSRGSKEDIH
jgi:hypothetical protein